MDITPIYELKTRLRAAAIAGTNLISEDFRLKKAAENFAPLASASPVFAKINEMTGKLLSDGTPQNLLDTITLVDSVITTLGTVGVAGEPEPLDIRGNSTAVVNAPYSQLSALIDALTTSGSGNFSTVVTAQTEHPELFNDYRVKPALVKGLGASYGELADLVAKILIEIGEEIVPLVKNGFDPKGKKEMVRRVNVIETVCGASENSFYLEQLENAEKDVRKALVYALRHDEGNIEKLTELVKTEKGKVKTAALAALASIDCEKSAEFFEEYSKKKPLDVIKIMENVSTEWASGLTARLIDQLLVDDKGNNITLSQAADTKKVKLKEKTSFPELNSALWGKWGAEVEKIYREFDYKDASRQLSVRLGDTIIATKNESLMALAIELNNKSKLKGHYNYAETVARFMSAEDCSEWVKKKAGELRAKKVIDPKAIRDSDFTRVLGMISFKNGGYVLTTTHWDEMSEMWRYMILPISQPIKKITDIFIKYSNESYHAAMIHWIDPNDREYCDKLGKYYVDEFMKIPDMGLLNAISQTGVTNVKGLAKAYLWRYTNVNQYGLRNLIQRLPGDNDYKLAEAREIVELLRKGKLKVKIDADEFSLWVESELK